MEMVSGALVNRIAAVFKLQVALFHSVRDAAEGVRVFFASRACVLCGGSHMP